MTDKLERIDLSMRVLVNASEVTLRRIALAYLDAELGLESR